MLVVWMKELDETPQRLAALLQVAAPVEPILRLTGERPSPPRNARLVTSPLSAPQAAELLAMRDTGELVGWLVVSSSPSEAEALTQIERGAYLYLPLNPLDVSLTDVILSRDSLTGEAAASLRREGEVLRLLTSPLASQMDVWAYRLEALRRLLEASALVLLTPDGRAFRAGVAMHSDGWIGVSELAREPQGSALLGAWPKEKVASARGLEPLLRRANRLIGPTLVSQWLLTRVLRAKREWEETVDTLSDPLALLSAEGEVLRANKSFASLVRSNVKAVVGLSAKDLLGHRPEELEALSTEGEQGLPGITLASAPNRSFVVRCSKVGLQEVIVHLREVSAERHLTSRLLERERFSALGELANGLFHDLNNLAGALRPELASARLALPVLEQSLSKLGVRQPARQQGELELKALSEALCAATSATERIEEMLGNLRLYTRLKLEGSPPGRERQRIQLNRLLQALHVLFVGQARRQRVSVALLPGQLPSVEGDAGALMRVLENLVRNALQAMPTGGMLTLSSSMEGSEAQVEVEDNGVGIDPELMPHIFEQGVTSRASEGGTGQGLFIAAQIMAAHGGRLLVTSRPGRTCFALRLPVRSDPWGE